MIKIFKNLLLFILIPVCSTAQTSSYTLDQIQELAKSNYPLLKQRDLINQSAVLTNANLNRNYLPQLSISGQATYQSDVTSVPIKVPGINIESLDKDQYKVYGEITQVLFDGGTTQSQKRIQSVAALTEEEKLNVELNKLRDRINQLYIGILLYDEQLKQNAIIQIDLDEGIKKVDAQVKNAVAYNSNLYTIQAESLKNKQRKEELATSRSSLIATLGIFINQELSNNTTFILPIIALNPSLTIARPELKLFSIQDSLLNFQSKLIGVKNRPRLFAFAQGGYGKPALNQLKNEFDTYYIGGVKLNWSLGGLYTSNKEKKINTINRSILDSQRELFILNTNATLKQYTLEIAKLNELLRSDDEIIQLRNKIKTASNAQLANNVITSSDYIREINAADQANQNKTIHQLQLVQAQLNYQFTLGN